MNGVLNENTNRVHKRVPEEKRLTTVCGATKHVEDTALDAVDLDETTRAPGTEKCGRCFADAGGY